MIVLLKFITLPLTAGSFSNNHGNDVVNIARDIAFKKYFLKLKTRQVIK